MSKATRTAKVTRRGEVAWRRARHLAARFVHSRDGIAATEFAVIVPIMLVLFFGVVALSNAITVYRKVTITAHTLSDLTSQSISVASTDLTNIFCAANGVMTPYVSGTCPSTAVTQSIVELWVNPSLQARVQWGVNSDGSSPPAAGTVVQIPTSLLVANTYIIYSSVMYSYTPVVGYGAVRSFSMSDFAYTRPRQSQCVLYNTTTCPTS